jgi:hypothetical protein
MSGAQQVTFQNQRSFGLAPGSATIDYLVVAGGGGVGTGTAISSDVSGAGGAGGLVFGSTLASSFGSVGTTVAIQVGAYGPTGSSTGSNGSSSYLAGTIHAPGGGHGGGYSASAGNGGSGGGAAKRSTPQISGISTQQVLFSAYGGIGLGTPGFGTSAANAAGGGAQYQGASGGGGYVSSISGVGVEYSRGGKGGTPAGTPTGAFANGSGYGHGGSSRRFTAAYFTSARSGIVIIRYPDAYPAASVSGSPTILVSGGYRIYTWTGNGSIVFP